MHQWYLIYDDYCGVCNTGVEKVKKLDKTGLIKLVPLSKPDLPEGIALPSAEALSKHMHLISPDGVTYKGADGVARLLSIFPQSKLAGKISSFPPFRPIARLIYAIVARNRMKISKLIGHH